MKTPIHQGIAQSDLDMAGFNLLNFTGGGGTAHGIPAGGTTGQLLKKLSGTDYDANWATIASGGGGGGGGIPLYFVNVKDAPYNATGDGVTDDTVAINTAIADVVTAGGGTVFLPKGVYLCNGAFNAFWKSILVIPSVVSGGSVMLTLLGEDFPSWSAGGATDQTRHTSIKTTRTDGMTAESNGFAAIIAGNVPFGNALHSSYGDMNACMTRIKNIQFLCPTNPTMGAIRLDGVGNAFVEDVAVDVDDFGATQPTHGTTAVWMPNAINWSISWMLHVSVKGFDTGFKVGEHLRAPMIQAYNCMNGISFLESQYPSWANIQLANCVEGIRFLGSHTVDLVMETEHAPSGWYFIAHDIKDPSNLGQGVIRYYIGHGTPTLPTVAAAVDGGTGLTLVDLCGGSVTMNTTQGASGGPGLFTGKVFATNPLLIGYYDTGLARSNTSELKVTDGSTGLGNLVAGTVYIGTDLRLVPISGGGKLQARNTGTNTWADVDQWTNP